MHTKEVNYNGKKVVYFVEGNGKPVVLLHGFGEVGTIWQQQVQSLQKEFKVIVPQLPGTGDSDLMEETSMEALADSVQAVLDAEGIEDCAMIGHSMGGYVTLAFAERHKRYLKGFGLFHSTAFGDSEEKKATRQKGIEFISRNGAAAFLKTSVPNLFAPTTKEKAPALIEQLLQKTNGFTDAALIKYYEAMMARPDRTQLLKDTELPVLFVLGRHDAAVPPEDGWKQCYLPQKSYIHMLEQSGHMGMLEQPELSNRLLTEYLVQTL